MAGQLIPLPEFSPPVPKSLSREQCVQLWMDHMDTCEQFLLAGLQREAGPEQDVTALYRKWYEQVMDDHDRAMIRMGNRLEIARGTQ